MQKPFDQRPGLLPPLSHFGTAMIVSALQFEPQLPSYNAVPTPFPALFFLIALTISPLEAKSLIGSPKTVTVSADGTIIGSVAFPMMGHGGYIKGCRAVDRGGV